MEIQKELFSLQDKEYMKFLSKLTPNVSEDTIIGVRIPEIRKLAKKLVKNNEYEDFLKELKIIKIWMRIQQLVQVIIVIDKEDTGWYLLYCIYLFYSY